ncbi:hypothetical protein GCM10010402_41200 [Actinomadura luteofluorescens]
MRWARHGGRQSAWAARAGTQTGGPLPDVPVVVFRHAAVVEVPNLGNVAEQEPSGCVTALQTGFIRDLKIRGTSCLADIPPVPYTPDHPERAENSVQARRRSGLGLGIGRPAMDQP